MGEPEKPFSCREFGCGASFTNADRLAVHSKKHDLALQLGNKGGTFVADQTPTPTRFIRNCEEVGLFQDLQNVNIFEDSFKREMERSTISHLNLVSNLTTQTNISEDALHTPHIFPHMPEDSSSNIFIDKSDDVPDLSQPATSKCLTLVENVSSLTTQNDNDNEKRNVLIVENNDQQHKTFVLKPRSKLFRQNSIDVEDDDDLQIEDISDTSKLKIKSIGAGLKNRRIIQRSSHNEIRVPVISVSDTTKNSNDQLINNDSNIKTSNSYVNDKLGLSVENHDQTKNSNLLTIPDINEKINLKNRIKGNFVKLITQKSIDMALAKFTNEANDSTVDLNNISIEDIPSISDINNEMGKSVSLTTEKQLDLIDSSRQVQIIDPSNHITSDVLNTNVIYTNKNNVQTASPKIFDSTKSILNEPLNLPVNDTNIFNYVPRKTVISQKTSCKTTEINNKEQGEYELTLKLPDGKKVYLKEISRDDEGDKTPSKNILPTSIMLMPNDYPNADNVSATVKRKLKDTIQSNTKKLTRINSDVAKIPIKPMSITERSQIKDYSFMPQTFIVNNFPASNIVTNSVQVLPVTTVIQQPQDVSFTNNKNEKSNLKSTLPKTQSEVIIGEMRDDGKTNGNVSEENINSKDMQKKLSIQTRNRAAVNRYRSRQKLKYKILQKQNQELVTENKHLTERLKCALNEIKVLKQTLESRNNYPFTLQTINNIGVIQSTEILNVNAGNSKSNQAMVIVQNNKKKSIESITTDIT